jgi:hypothetical protein
MANTAETQTEGQRFAATIRRIQSIGPRTRARRDGLSVREGILDAVRNAAQYPGYYGDETTAALRPAMPIVYGWDKHIDGYRVDGEVRYALTSLSPWRFAEFVGRLIDDGVTNVGEMETWLRQHGREYVTEGR